jgi:serine/threonine-protein kinase HipA
VQFCRPDRLTTVEHGGALVPLTGTDLSRLLADLTDTATGWGVQSHTGQFSLAGAQAKVALRRTADGWARASGVHPTTHILKPAIAGMADQELGEHLTMRTARNLGLPVPGTQVRTFQGVRALIVQRYDRRTADGLVHRVHQEDLVQALGRPPSDKYEASGGPGIVDLVNLLRRVVSPREHIDSDVLRFLDAVAFNQLIGGADAHVKNFSLLLAGSQVRLAPLYDLNSFLPYNSSRTHVELAMSIGPSRHTRSTDITAEDWRWLALRVQIDPDRLVARVAAMAEALPDAAGSAAKDPDIDDPTASVDAFGHRFVDAVAALSYPTAGWSGRRRRWPQRWVGGLLDAPRASGEHDVGRSVLAGVQLDPDAHAAVAVFDEVILDSGIVEVVSEEPVAAVFPEAPKSVDGLVRGPLLRVNDIVRPLGEVRTVGDAVRVIAGEFAEMVLFQLGAGGELRGRFPDELLDLRVGFLERHRRLLAVGFASAGGE